MTVKFKFEGISLAEVKEVARIVARYRVSVIIRVFSVLTLSLVERRVGNVYLAHLIGLNRTLKVIVPLWAETHLGYDKVFSACEFIWIVPLKVAVSLFRDTQPFVSDDVT